MHMFLSICTHAHVAPHIQVQPSMAGKSGGHKRAAEPAAKFEPDTPETKKAKPVPK